jgi:threonine synthase
MGNSGLRATTFRNRANSPALSGPTCLSGPINIVNDDYPMNVICLNCGRPYPEVGAPYCCPTCGGLFDYAAPFPWRPNDLPALGIWRDVRTFGLELEPVSLGEGQTPLVPAIVLGRKVYFKCEYANPTGSFKDRGTATLISFLRSRGVARAIEDSSGNAGASFAAYAARAGIEAHVFVPAAASGPKRQQIQMYGARLSAVEGARSNAADAARVAAQAGETYASHAYMPFNSVGYATCAAEIVEQLGAGPAAVILPAGQGGLLLGLARGFQSLLNASKIERLPVIVGVQAAACAPLAALFDMGLMGMNFVTEGETVAEGVRVRSPLRAEAVLRAVRDSNGRLLSIAEEAILLGRDSLVRLGFYVEPTSALVWPAMQEILADLGDPVVTILTGSGYKVRV